MTILFCYFHLCVEDYRWAWRAFLTGSASALYAAVYSAVYYHARLQFDDVASLILYFGWSVIMASMFFVLTGKFLCLTIRGNWISRMLYFCSHNLRLNKSRLVLKERSTLIFTALFIKN